ncbi:MAG: metallophosphoesterase family protein, partial [Chlamydiia bacterium]|nr:metallophosphoesterase family protein [Chlamydiia bacterium]
MLIGVFSDIHDNLENLDKALAVFHDRQVESLIFCGDFCSPIPSRVVGGGFKGDIHVVFGNGDG